ncbi:hypothetical protein YQE_03496, partial [Dendroctonus ponderosae]
MFKRHFSQYRRMASTSEAKAALRTEIASKLAKLTCEEKLSQSKSVFQKLMNLNAFKSSKRVSVFLSTATEIDTEPIVRKIFQDGKQYSKAGMQMVKLASMEDWTNLPLTKWNIKQPLLADHREDAFETGGLDLIICPGVAFTRTGDRLGHGGGYYDAYIKKLQEIQECRPATVALAFKEQVVERLPLGPTDVTIDLVLYAE